MAAITVTAIELGSDATTQFVQFGEAIGLGDSVYKDVSDAGKWKKADADAGEVQAGRDGVGIALHAISADGRWGVIVTGGTVYIDTLGVGAKGTTYIVGATAAGDIAPDSDAASGDYKTTLGVGGTEGTSNTVDEFQMLVHVSGQQIA